MPAEPNAFDKLIDLARSTGYMGLTPDDFSQLERSVDLHLSGEIGAPHWAVVFQSVEFLTKASVAFRGEGAGGREYLAERARLAITLVAVRFWVDRAVSRP